MRAWGEGISKIWESHPQSRDRVPVDQSFALPDVTRPPPPFANNPRTDGYHVGNQQQQFVQQQPPNQPANQGPGIRTMASSGPPPTQASTPPNAEMKVSQIPQSITMPFNPRGPPQNFQISRPPVPPNQPNRMTNRPLYPPTPMSYIQPPPGQSFYVHNNVMMVGNTQRPAANYITPNYPIYSSPTPFYHVPQHTQGPHLFSYPQSFQMPRPMTPTQVPMPPQTQPAATNIIVSNIQPQGPTSKTKVRRKHALKVIDPTTGKDKLNEVYEDSPESGESSARQSPQPDSHTSETPELFVKPQLQGMGSEQSLDDVVGVGVGQTNSHDLTDPQMYHPAHQHPHQMVLNTGHEAVLLPPSKLKAQTKEFIPGIPSNISAPSKETPVVSAISDAAEVTVKPNRESPNKGGRKPREREHKDSAKDAAQKESVHDKPKDKEATSASPKEAREAPRDDKRSQKKDRVEKAASPPVTNDTPPESVPTMPTHAPENGKNKNSQKKDPPKQQQAPQNAGGPAPSQKAAPPVPPTQPSKPNNKSNRVRDINTKGATKEGTDMDAFNDKLPTGVNNVSNAVASDIFNANSVAVTVNNNNNINEFARNDSLRTEAPVEAITEPAVEAQEPRNDNSNVNVNLNAEARAGSKEPFPKVFTKGKCVTDIVKEIPRPIKITVAAVTSDETDCTAVVNDRIVQVKNDVNKTGVDIEGNLDSKLQLQYKEGQWSPMNPAGKKVYDKDFLMALKDDPKSKKKPNCSIIDVVLSDDKRGGDGKYPMGGRSDFASNFGGAKSASLRGVNKRRSTQNQSGVNNNKNSSKKVMSFSLKEDVKLHESEHAWKPARFIASDTMSEEDKKTEILYKKMRGILNKLTPQKFEVLVGQIRSLQIDTTERLQGVMDLIFEKAVDEPNFSEAYASLCKELRRFSVSNEKDSSNFLKLLVMRCQMEFERYTAEDKEKQERRLELEAMTDLEKKKELLAVLEEDERLLRVRSVGNVRFIGELFKLNMLTIRIMESCLLNLVQKREDEENLECLCKLLTTVGSDLEFQHKMDLKSIFDIMQEIVKNTKRYKISSRVRFMLKDTIDLRERKWVPRRANLAPKTMDQIQKEAENEHLTIQVMNSMPSSHRKDDRGSMGPNSDRKGSNRRNANVTNEEGWTTPAARSNRSGVLHVQVDKLKNKAPQFDEPLGSNKQYSNWAHGSTIKPQSSPANIFTCLDNNLETEKRAIGSRGSTSRDFGYMSKGSSMERHGKYEGRGSRSGSQHRSNDQRDMRPQTQPPAMVKMPPPAPKAVSPSPPPVAPAGEPVELTDTQITHLGNTLDEYNTQSLTLDEAIEELFTKIPGKAERASIVDNAVLHTLESQRSQRIRTGQFLATLLSRHEITVDHIANISLFSMIDDFIIDIPKLFDYLAELMFHSVAENASLLPKLANALGPVKPKGWGRKFLEPLFHLFVEDKSPVQLQQQWQTSGCSFEDFVHESELQEFITKNNLDFLTGLGVQPVGQSNQSPEQLYNKLKQFFQQNESFDSIVSWINANIGHKIKEHEYIRALATAVFEDSIRDNVLCPEVFKSHYNLLMKFVDHNTNLELQCLNALQRLLYKLEYPKGLVLDMFNRLYEDSIFTQESFIHWEKYSADEEGKGVALAQLRNFLFDLSQVDDDGSDEA